MPDAPALDTYSNKQVVDFLDADLVMLAALRGAFDMNLPAHLEFKTEFENWIRLLREAERDRLVYAIECMGAIPATLRAQIAAHLRSLTDPPDPLPVEEPHKTLPGISCSKCAAPAICFIEKGAYCEECEPTAPAGIRLYERQIRSM